MDYIAEYSRKADQLLLWLEKETNLRSNYARMLCGAEEGTLLEFISKMISPKHILEIGTFTGYSAICLARGLRDGGRLDALEINDELEDLIEEGFSRAGVSDKISLHIGDAMEFLAAQQGKKEYDLTFIDANKREYPDYYEHVLALTRTGGFILADDVLWDGKVYAEHVPSDKQTAGIVRFNDLAAQDPRVETVILPVRHGLSIIRKK